LIGFFISLLFVKPLFPINKQFSVDAFLDWEGHHWDIRSTGSSHHHSQFPLLFILLPTHLARR